MRSPEEELELESKTGSGSDRYSFRTADGVSSKDSFRESELLPLDAVEPEQDDSILVARANYGVLGILGDYAPGGDAKLFSVSDRSRRLAESNLRRNGIDNAGVELGETPGSGDFDTAVYAPRGYTPVSVAKNCVVRAVKSLRSGGTLYVAGDSHSGITRIENLLGRAEGRLEKHVAHGGQKVYSFKKQEETGLPEQNTTNSFEASALGAEARFETRDGLFSATGLDDGTRLLLESVEPEKGDTVLDLACGYGAVSVFLGLRYGVELVLSDDSCVATDCAERNMELNGIENYRVETTDCLEGLETGFDLIVSNPPTHQGSGITDEMIEQSRSKLADGGELYLVFNRNMHLERKMEQVFGNSEKVAERDNFVVYGAAR